MSDSLILTLIILGIIALSLLIIALVYFILILRRSNNTLKKIDYLVEDFTYKSESLNVAVDAINKISNYVLKFDTFSRRASSSLIKAVSNNREYFYSFLDNFKKRMASNAKKNEKNKTKISSQQKKNRKK